MTSTNLRMRCSWSSGAKDTEGTKNEQVKKKPPEDTDARTRSTVRRECTACVRYTAPSNSSFLQKRKI